MSNKSNPIRLRVQIGKKTKAAGLKKRVYRFEGKTIEELAEKLTTINIPKMMEECFFRFELGEKKREISRNALIARRFFNNKLNAYFFIKQQFWMVK